LWKFQNKRRDRELSFERWGDFRSYYYYVIDTQDKHTKYRIIAKIYPHLLYSRSMNFILQYTRILKQKCIARSAARVSSVVQRTQCQCWLQHGCN
jgi:hypothetical protein